jgi:hypothetical protein
MSGRLALFILLWVRAMTWPGVSELAKRLGAEPGAGE